MISSADLLLFGMLLCILLLSLIRLIHESLVVSQVVLSAKLDLLALSIKIWICSDTRKGAHPPWH